MKRLKNFWVVLLCAIMTMVTVPAKADGTGTDYYGILDEKGWEKLWQFVCYDIRFDDYMPPAEILYEIVLNPAYFLFPDVNIKREFVYDAQDPYRVMRCYDDIFYYSKTEAASLDAMLQRVFDIDINDIERLHENMYIKSDPYYVCGYYYEGYYYRLHGDVGSPIGEWKLRSLNVNKLDDNENTYVAEFEYLSYDFFDSTYTTYNVYCVFSPIYDNKDYPFKIYCITEDDSFANWDELLGETDTQSTNIREAYKNVLINFKRQYGVESYIYYIYDIDKNGTPELIVKDEASSEAEKKMYFFTFNGKEVIYLGNKSGFHTSLCSIPNANGVMQFIGLMGNENADMISIYGNELIEENILSWREITDSYSEPWEIIEGSERLDYYDCNDFFPLYTLSCFNSMPNSSTVQISLAAFPITINGMRVKSGNIQYPFIVYNGITYVPMTYNNSRFLGLETEWSAETGLNIRKTNVFYFAFDETQGAQNPAVDTAEIAGGRIVVNGKEIANASEDYPLLLYRNVTYFPLTWRFAVDEFGWDYSFDAANGLAIEVSDVEIIETESAGETTDYLDGVIFEL